MLGQRLRRWPNIETTMDQRPASAGTCGVSVDGMEAADIVMGKTRNDEI